MSGPLTPTFVTAVLISLNSFQHVTTDFLKLFALCLVTIAAADESLLHGSFFHNLFTIPSKSGRLSWSSSALHKHDRKRKVEILWLFSYRCIHTIVWSLRSHAHLSFISLIGFTGPSWSILVLQHLDCVLLGLLFSSAPQSLNQTPSLLSPLSPTCPFIQLTNTFMSMSNQFNQGYKTNIDLIYMKNIDRHSVISLDKNKIK